MAERLDRRTSPLDACDLRDRVQAVLDEVLDAQRTVLAEVGDECVPLADAVADLLAGGKRLRPAFCYWGWRGAGGPDCALVVRVAASLELFQAAALLHDDVMDRSDTRRGKAAMHRAFEAMHADRGWAGDADQFGHAAAILAGDLCLSWNGELFASALAEHGPARGLDASRLTDATRVFDRMRTELMAGQYLDVSAQASAGRRAQTDPDLDQVALARRVIRFKSAKYTIEHPLAIGAALAGAAPDLRDAYRTYGLALGEAFQLRDDVLGVFGDPALTGKPAGDDLREGKRTVLVALAMREGDAAQRRALAAGLGRADLDDADVAELRDVLSATGALATTEAMIAELVEEAREALATAPLDAEARDVLEGLVQTATVRSA